MFFTIKIRWYFFIVVAILVLVAFPVFGFSCCGVPTKTQDKESKFTESGEILEAFGNPSAPDFTVPTLDGGTFTLSSQRGKPVVLFIMASWCTTCINEAQELDKLYEKYRDQIIVIALDIDRSSTQENLKRFKALAGNPDYIWAFDKGGTVVRDYKIRALGTTFIFNQNSEVVYNDSRSTSYKTLEKQIKNLL